jgi:hypothetical protein
MRDRSQPLVRLPQSDAIVEDALCVALPSVEIDEPGWPAGRERRRPHGSDAQPQEALGHHLQAMDAEDPANGSSTP